MDGMMKLIEIKINNTNRCSDKKKDGATIIDKGKN